MRDTRRGRMVALLASALVLASCDPDGPTAAEAPSAAAHRVQITIAGDGVGTVSATPSGLSCATGGSGCAASVAPGSTISLTASAGAGSTFGGWTGPACGSASVCVLTVDAAQTVTATFVRAQTFTLGVTTAGAGAGDVASAPAGIACARGAAGAQSGTCEATFAAPTAVTLTATPVAGSTFAGWSGTGASACGSAAACTVAMSAARSVTATFAPSPVALTVVTTGAGAGTVGSTPVGVDCRRAADGTRTGTCEAPFAVGSAVTLVASPAAGSTFLGWSGGTGCSTAATCTVTLAAAQTVTATFAPAPVTLAVVLAGTGGGTVAATPAADGAIDCVRSAAAQRQAGSCEQAVTPGTAVTLTATPVSGSSFAGWSGGGCVGTAPCRVTPQAAATVTATFDVVRLPLTITTAGAGGGTVTSSPSGIACTRSAESAGGAQSGSCAASYATGVAVTLDAAAAPGSTFQGWSGGSCTGTDDCVVTMSGARAVTATFAVAPPPTVPLTVSTRGDGAGRVSSAPAGIDCARTGSAQTGSCTAGYASGASVTLVAAPSPGSIFTGWSGGGCSGTGACVVAATTAQTVTANFWPAPVFLNVGTAGAGSGTVSSSPAGIACTRSGGMQGGTCGTSFVAGTSVTLAASPTAGSTFTGWSGGGCSGTGPCPLTLRAAQSVTATFAPAPPPQATLTVTVQGGSIFGGGTVTSTPGGLSCTRPGLGGAESGTCSASFDVGSLVTLVATPTLTPGSYFSGWGGSCASITPTCTVTMSAARSVVAVFITDVSAPTLTVSGVANGGTYVTHPPVTLSYSDDIGFGATPLRVMWSVVTPAGTRLCAAGMGAGSAIFVAATGPTCPTVNFPGVGGLLAPGLTGTITLTVQSVDMAGNVSAPRTVSYTVGS